MNRLRDLREDRDLKLSDVGSALGFSANALSNYERENRALTAELINKFCDFYGVTADYLLCRSNRPQESVSKSDTEYLAAYHTAPPEIRRIVDAALEPYRPQARGEEETA